MRLALVCLGVLRIDAVGLFAPLTAPRYLVYVAVLLVVRGEVVVVL